MSCCSELLKAIDRYIEKADNDLEQQLKQKGYKDTKRTVKAATALEEAFVEALTEENKSVLSAFKGCETVEEFYKKYWPQLKADGKLRQVLEEAYRTTITGLIQPLVETYMPESEPIVAAGELTKRTTGWIESWGGQLAHMMKVDNAEKLESIFIDGIDTGSSISDIITKLQNEKIRPDYVGARRTAITEVLSAHSVAHQEAMDLSPSINRKMWRHSGYSKTKPRENHVAMNGQTVQKDKPFELVGADGVTYKPMFPRDTILPAGERINCHCLSQGIVDDDVLGMSLEDRKRLQDEARAKIDSDYAAKLDAENKAKAGITETPKKTPLERMKELSDKEQQKRFGKGRWALVRSGTVTESDQLFKTTSTKSGKVTTRKTLKEISDSGIMTLQKYKNAKGKTVDPVVHSTVGEFSQRKNPNKPAGGANGGNMKSGGHTQSNIKELDKRGIHYEIAHTYQNGVRVGGVEGHNEAKKRPDTHQQTWFPEDWSDDDVLVAGTHVANNPEDTDGTFVFGTVNGVRIGVLANPKTHCIETIFPDFNKQPLGDGGWEVSPFAK